MAREAVQVKVKGLRLIGKLTDIAKAAARTDAKDIPALKLQADIYFGLLKKVLPDQKALEITGDVTHRDAIEYSRDELQAIAGTGSKRAAAANGRDREPTSVH